MHCELVIKCIFATKLLNWMNISFSNITNNIKTSIVNPKSFWIEKKDNLDNQAMLLLGYFFPLLIIAAITVFFGELFRSNHFYIGFALLKSLRVIVLFVLQYFLAVVFTSELMKTFGGIKNKSIAQNLVVYSITPFMLVSIVTGLFPFLYVIDVLGFYGFFIFWVGAKETLNDFPENKQSSYILITIVVNFFVFSFLSITLSKLLTAYY